MCCWELVNTRLWVSVSGDDGSNPTSSESPSATLGNRELRSILRSRDKLSDNYKKGHCSVMQNITDLFFCGSALLHLMLPQHRKRGYWWGLHLYKPAHLYHCLLSCEAVCFFFFFTSIAKLKSRKFTKLGGESYLNACQIF